MLKILYLDDDIVVVHKPSGLLVHRSAIDKYETKFLLQILRDQLNQRVYPVHRLDKPTSGVMVLALHKTAAQLLTQSFTERQTQKQYMAIVRGYVESQIVDYPLKEIQDKMTDSLADKDKLAQSAITHVELVKTTEVPIALEHYFGRYKTARYSLVKLIPKTGRKHQLRRHMAHIRHPIIGDTTHGDGKQNKFARAQFDMHRLALVANKLSFEHPTTKKLIDCSSSADNDLNSMLALFRDLVG